MADNDLNIETSLTIEAPPEAVWTCLTSTEYAPRWLGCMRYEKGIGNVFYMQQDEDKRKADDIEGATHCEILTLDEPNEFAFSWFLPGTPKTVVHLRLAASDNGTVVTLTHTGWELFDAVAIRQIRDALAEGWKSFVLPNLKRVTEAGIAGSP